MKIVKAPNIYDTDKRLVFLAGSIEMGTAISWQDQVCTGLQELNNIVILNPRRDDWDKNWTQTLENKQFVEQVIWELEAMDNASLIAMYFDKDTKSPITLLELGLFASTNKRMVVCCPEGFYRKGNVDIVCLKYKIRTVPTLEALINYIKYF
jgi:hypothetical protein